MSRFRMICEASPIEHRLTKLNHPWIDEDQTPVQRTGVPTNGQVEQKQRNIKDATTKRYHHEQLRAHLLDATNHVRRLTTLIGLAPAQFS